MNFENLLKETLLKQYLGKKIEYKAHRSDWQYDLFYEKDEPVLGVFEVKDILIYINYTSLNILFSSKIIPKTFDTSSRYFYDGVIYSQFDLNDPLPKIIN